MRLTLISAVSLLTLAACGPGGPGDSGDSGDSGDWGDSGDSGTRDASGATVVRAAQGIDAEGPGESADVASSELLGAIRLSDEFPAMEGWVMRARVVTVAPDAQISVHGHESRPGIAYVLEGNLIEYRNDDPPAMRRAGDVAFENTGTIHWWENASDRPARLIVVDIVPGDS